MKPTGQKSYLPTKKKGNVTINPKKEDLMSENLRRQIQSSIESLKEASKKKEKHIKAAKAGKRWQDSDGDGKWYEPGDDVKKEAVDAPAKPAIDTSDAKAKAKDRMKQKMMQATQDMDAKRQGRIAG
tara:strand:+ start:10296 stop:10676 length:381 start_codon:yes stop_codon:yes gene_type:complete